MKKTLQFTVWFTLIILAMCVANTVRAFDMEGVQLVATNYSLTQITRNNMGLFFNKMEDSRRYSEELGSQTLIITHTVFFQGKDALEVKMIISSYVYAYAGGRTIPTGGYKITVFGFSKKVKGKWFASTNTIPASQMFSFNWDPFFVGKQISVSEDLAVATTGSSIVLTGRNITSSPKTVVFPCITDTGLSFNYNRRFSGGESSVFYVSLVEANSWQIPGGGVAESFSFNPDYVRADE